MWTCASVTIIVLLTDRGRTKEEEDGDEVIFTSSPNDCSQIIALPSSSRLPLNITNRYSACPFELEPLRLIRLYASTIHTSVDIYIYTYIVNVMVGIIANVVHDRVA